MDGYLRYSDRSAIARFKTEVLPLLRVILPDLEIIECSAEIYSTLERGRMRIGINDCFIAATAIVQDLVLVTSNETHFRRIQVEGFPLRVENWRLP